MDSRWARCADWWKTIGGERVELNSVYTDGWKGTGFPLKNFTMDKDRRSLLLILQVKINEFACLFQVFNVGVCHS